MGTSNCDSKLWNVVLTLKYSNSISLQFSKMVEGCITPEDKLNISFEFV